MLESFNTSALAEGRVACYGGLGWGVVDRRTRALSSVEVVACPFAGRSTYRVVLQGRRRVSRVELMLREEKGGRRRRRKQKRRCRLERAAQGSAAQCDWSLATGWAGGLAGRWYGTDAPLCQTGSQSQGPLGCLAVPESAVSAPARRVVGSLDPALIGLRRGPMAVDSAGVARGQALGTGSSERCPAHIPCRPFGGLVALLRWRVPSSSFLTRPLEDTAPPSR